MTVEEAIIVVRRGKECAESLKKWYTASYMALEALKKQIPKKPIELMGEIVGYFQCPNCKNYLGCKQPYCDNCGQALDWSEEQ